MIIQKEDKNLEAVPKITLKLGAVSRPATPDNAPTKKMLVINKFNISYYLCLSYCICSLIVLLFCVERLRRL